MDPKVSVTMSRECSIIFSFVNTSQVGQGMSREMNEHSVESETEGIRKGLYIDTAVPKLKNNNKKNKIKRTLVPVPLLLVPVLPKQKEAVAFWYQYHTYRYRYRRE